MKKIVWMMVAVALMAGCSSDDENEVVEPIKDASGKNVMVFTTHEGSGLADAIERIKEQEPNATVSTSGFHSRGNNVASQGDAIRDWITGLGLATK